MAPKNNFPILSSNRNIFLITFYVFFTNLAYNIGNGIGLLKYVQDWGLTINGLVNATILGFIVKFCCQLGVGYYGDKLKSKYGRRKPFLVTGYIVKSFAILMLATPVFKGGEEVFGWYTLFYILFQIGTEFADSPFDAWMIECTKDDQDYRKIYSVAGPIGGFLGGVTGLVLTIFSPLIGSLLYLVGGGCFTFLVVWYISSHVSRTQPPLPELVPSIRICARTNEFKSIFCLRVLVDSGVNIFVTVVGYYVLIGFSLETVKSYVNYLLFGSIIGASLGIPLTVLMNWILFWYDKITLYLSLIALVILLGLIAFIITTPAFNSFQGYFIVLCLMNTLSYPAKLFDRLIIRDLVTYDTFMTGLNRENMYLMALTLPTTILSTFIGGIPAMIIMFCGYSEDTDVDDDEIDQKYDWNNTTLWLLRVSGSLVFSLLAVFAYIVLKRYPLTSPVAQQMNDVNKKREEEKIQEEEETNAYEREEEEEQKNYQINAEDSLRSPLLETNDGSSNLTMEDHPMTSTLSSSPSPPPPSLRYLFLHFSVEELYFMANFNPTTSSFSSSSPPTPLSPSTSALSSALTLQNFYYIQFLNSLMLYFGIFTGACVVVVIVVDIYTRDGGLSTLFINVLMILIFFILYSFFRYLSLKKMQEIFHLSSTSPPSAANLDYSSSSSSSSSSAMIPTPSSISFHTTIQFIYHDFTHYHQSLKEMLKKEEILSDFYSKDHASSLLDPITEENDERKLRGFKRIFVMLLLVSVISLVIISFELS